jgi:hypothetical protein
MPAAAWVLKSAKSAPASSSSAFPEPPADARMTAWYFWFGPSQTASQVSRELEAMRNAGIGGVYVFLCYPLTTDDNINYPYLSPRFLEVLRFTLERANELSMTVDLMVGTGWPFGGPGIKLEQSSRLIRRLPQPEFVGGGKPGDQLIATDEKRGVVYISSPTRQRVKAAAIGGEGWVLDHLSREETQRYLDDVPAKLIATLPKDKLRSIGFGSLEAFYQDWTPTFPEEFRKRRGYDLVPHLAALWEDIGEETGHVRHDYWLTLTDVYLDNFQKPFHDWSRRRGIAMQGAPLGWPIVDLRAWGPLDIAQSEDHQWLQFGGPRWLSSGGRLYNHNVLFNESYCWLRNPRYMESLQDMKVASDALFVCGVNAILAHAFSYSPPETGIPGWSFYASTYFNPKNTWWPYLPHLTKYVQRVSFILRQGRPVADIALYLPEDDEMASVPAGGDVGSYSFGTKVFVERRLSGAKTNAEFRDAAIWSEGLEATLRSRSPLVSTMVTNGYCFDGINNDALQKASITGGRLKFGQGDYGVLVLPEITGLPVETMEKISAFGKAGGKVIAIGRTPSLCYGLPGWREKSARVGALSAELFSETGGGLVAADSGESFLQALRQSHAPDIDFERADPMVGFVHRRTDSRDYYFLANMTPEPKPLRGVFRVGHRQPEFWDAIAGTTRICPEYRYVNGGTEVPFELGPYGSLIVSFGRSTEPCARVSRRSVPAVPAALRIGGPWTLEIGETRVTLEKLGSWTEDERFRYFSGSGVYRAEFTLADEYLAPGLKLWLHLGEVREIADVELNGRPVGVAWMLPYQLDITGAVRRGKNRMAAKVTNLLINRVLGQPEPDVKAITEKFGSQFAQVQEMLPHAGGKDLKWEQNFEKQKVKSPLPSGLLGEVEIRPAWEG